PKIFRRWRFHEIVAVDVKLAAKWNLASSSIWVLGIVDCVELFAFSFRIICQQNFDWSQHDETARCAAIEFIAPGVLEQSHVGHAWVLRNPDVVRQAAQ